jgi:hypothetical protein
MTFNSDMIDHPTIPVAEIKPRIVRYLDTDDPNGIIVSNYITYIKPEPWNGIPGGLTMVTSTRYHAPRLEGQLIFVGLSSAQQTTLKAYVSVAPLGDNFWPYDSLIMNMDGFDGSNDFLDCSENNYSFTSYGDVVIASGNGISNNNSAVFNGGYIEIPVELFKFGTNDFTFEFWLDVDSVQASNSPYVFGSSQSDTGKGFNIYLPDPNNLWGGNDRIVFESSVDSNGPILESTSEFKGQGWKHVAITRNASTFKLFVNGIEEAMTINSTANYSGILGILGTDCPGLYGGGSYYTGYIDLFRVTQGACRYTSNFVPPTTFEYLKWKPTAQAPVFISPGTGKPVVSNAPLYSTIV